MEITARFFLDLFEIKLEIVLGYELNKFLIENGRSHKDRQNERKNREKPEQGATPI